ncbi:MAG: Sulphatase-modifying factor protein [Bacteroidetes bacterium]|nr:Sulphatase-modifying factor protein [Bacteroidota bacterium]
MKKISVLAAVVCIALAANAQSKKKTPPADPARFVNVEGGSFMMGTATGVEPVEKPEHKVQLKDFYLAKYELTFDEYDRFCDSTGRKRPDDMKWGRGKRPAMIVSWLDAVAYCNWLSKQDKLQPCYVIGDKDAKWLDTANGYRLPTEAEWEYAARGGKKSKGTHYAGADKPDNVAWYKANSQDKTQPVGQKQANEIGLYDMNGNVWEWVWDIYDGNYYQHSPEQDPKGPEAGPYKVTRGGAWYNKPEYTAVTTRQNNTPDFRQNSVGFRIARNK